MPYMKWQALLVFVFFIMFHFFLCEQIMFVGSRTAIHSAPLHTVGPWAVNTYLGRQDICCERWVPKGSDCNDYCLIPQDNV